MRKSGKEIQNKMKKLVKKMFNIQNMVDSIDEEKKLKEYILYKTNLEDIKDINTTIIENNNIWNEYCMYITLKKINDIYINAVCLEKFTDELNK